jgi:DNA-binding IclR family transcriptional regulator
MALNVHLSNTTAYAAVVEALTRTGGTVPELSDASGLALNTTRKFIRALRHRALVRTTLWRQDGLGRYTIAVWGWGSPVYDVKRPPRMTSTERSARRRVKKREMSTLLSMDSRNNP